MEIKKKENIFAQSQNVFLGFRKEKIVQLLSLIKPENSITFFVSNKFRDSTKSRFVQKKQIRQFSLSKNYDALIADELYHPTFTASRVAQ